MSMGKPPLKNHLSFKSKEPNVEVKFLYSQERLELVSVIAEDKLRLFVNK